jgi:UDP-N-acetyl-D-mannosaminuronic acid dehydrogenase
LSEEEHVFERGIAVIGLGYIGLPTSAVLASHGIRVHGVDVDPSTVEAINAGRVPIVEPDLDASVAGAVARGTLTAHLEVPAADAFIARSRTSATSSRPPGRSPPASGAARW